MIGTVYFSCGSKPEGRQGLLACFDRFAEPHLGDREYDPLSYEGEAPNGMTALYGYLHPGAKVARWGFIKGVNWYTLLGDWFVERLGGDAALRKALDREDIGVERINHCVLVRAGPFPRLGAPEDGLPEPYVFVNKVLRVLRNPKPDGLHFYDPHLPNADSKHARSWQARFDLPDASPIPEPPKVVPPRLGKQRQSVRESLPGSRLVVYARTAEQSAIFQAGGDHAGH